MFIRCRLHVLLFNGAHSVLQQVEVNQNHGTQTSLDQQQKCVCTVSSYCRCRTTEGTTAQWASMEHTLTHMHAHTTHIYAQSWQEWDICFCFGLTEAAEAAERWARVSSESGWNTAWAEDRWPFACVSLKKYPRPSDMRFDVSECEREETRKSLLQQLEFCCCCRTALKTGGFLLNVSLEDRNTIAPDSQYGLGVMFSLRSMSGADTKPLPYFIPALSNNDPYIFLIRRWQLD